MSERYSPRFRWRMSHSLPADSDVSVRAPQCYLQLDYAVLSSFRACCSNSDTWCRDQHIAAAVEVAQLLVDGSPACGAG